jgi:hypothetical protein
MLRVPQVLEKQQAACKKLHHVLFSLAEIKKVKDARREKTLTLESGLVEVQKRCECVCEISNSISKRMSNANGIYIDGATPASVCTSTICPVTNGGA